MLNIIAGSLSVGVTPSTSSYESIATVTVGSGGQSTITFSSIPATFKHLQIRVLARTTTATSFDAILLRYNSDTGANYATHTLLGTGTAVVAAGEASITKNYLDKAAGANLNNNVFAGIVADVLDYSSTTKYKTLRTLGGVDNNGSGVVHFSSGLWQNTNAVSSIFLQPLNGGDFAQYTSIALYGIKGA